MKTLKLSGNMRVIDFDPQTGQSDIDDPRDARIAELEAAFCQVDKNHISTVVNLKARIGELEAIAQETVAFLDLFEQISEQAFGGWDRLRQRARRALNPASSEKETMIKQILTTVLLSLALLVGTTPGNTQAQTTSATEKPAKTAFYCGATTKAGTPCKHRVKVQGAHCFQHGGKKEGAK